MDLSQGRYVSGSQFGDYARINLGDISTIHYHLPQRPARTAVRTIPYPHNKDVIQR